jgi:phage-related protein
MAYDIGPKIGIEGESDFRNAIKNINTNLKTLGTEMMAVTSKFDKNEQSTESLTAKNKVLNKQIDEQKNKLSELEKGLAASAEKYGQNDNVTQGWRQALNKATADLNKMERELKNNTETLEKGDKATDDMAEEVKRFGKNADEAGEKTLSFGDIIKANLISEAIIGGVKALGSAILGVAKNIGESVQNTLDYSGSISDMANKTGVGAEELQKYAYAAQMSGMEISTLESAMIKQQKAFADATTGSKLASEAYKELGINIDGISSAEAFAQVIANLADMTDTTKQNALANDIFGKSYAELAPLLNEGSSGIEALKKKAEELGIVMSEDAINSGEALGDTLDTLKLTTEGLTNSVVTMLLPGLASLAEGATTYMADFSAAIQVANGNAVQIGEIIGATLSDLANKFIEKLPEIVEGAKSIIISFAGGIVENIPVILATGMSIITNLVNGIMQEIPEIIQTGLGVVQSLVNGIIGAIPMLIPAAISIITGLADNITGNIGTIVDMGIGLILALVQGLVSSLPTMIQEVPRIINEFSSAIYAQVPKILKAGFDIILMLIKGIIDSIPTLVANIPQIILAIVNVITLYNWASLGKSLITKIGEGISGMKGHIGTIAKELAESVISGIKNIFSGGVNIGNYLIEGLWNGILGAKELLLSKVKEFAGSIIGAFAEKWGIASPSKVMAEYGKYLDEGLAEGIEDNSDKPLSAMNSVASGINATIQTITDTANTAVEAIKDLVSSETMSKINKYNNLSSSEKDASRKQYNEQEKNFENTYDKEIRAYSKLYDVDLGVAKEILKKDLNYIPKYATGTNNHPGGLAWVGDNDKELVSLPRGTQVFNEEQLSNMFNRKSITLNLNIGTLVADDYGLKQLERKLSSIRIDENYRLGVTG